MNSTDTTGSDLHNLSTLASKATPKSKSINKPNAFKYYPNLEDAKIDAEKARFPYCIVWTPLPLITALIPFIGHTGIAPSSGIIHDFSGPYQITIDELAFGETHKYFIIFLK